MFWLKYFVSSVHPAGLLIVFCWHAPAFQILEILIVPEPWYVLKTTKNCRSWFGVCAVSFAWSLVQLQCWFWYLNVKQRDEMGGFEARRKRHKSTGTVPVQNIQIAFLFAPNISKMLFLDFSSCTVFMFNHSNCLPLQLSLDGQSRRRESLGHCQEETYKSESLGESESLGHCEGGTWKWRLQETQTKRKKKNIC